MLWPPASILKSVDRFVELKYPAGLTSHELVLKLARLPGGRRRIATLCRFRNVQDLKINNLGLEAKKFTFKLIDSFKTTQVGG